MAADYDRARRELAEGPPRALLPAAVSTTEINTSALPEFSRMMKFIKEQKLEAAVEQYAREQHNITSPHNPEKYRHLGFPVT